MFFLFKQLLCIFVFVTAASHLVCAQDKVNVRVNADWHEYLEVHSKWLEMRQQYTFLVAEHAKSELKFQKQKAMAERELLIHEHALKGYQGGQREVRLTGLRNEILIIAEKAKQAKVRRDWSVKLANRGLISQKELEADDIAVERLRGQLQTRKDELMKEEKQSGSSTEAELIVVRDKAKVALLEIKADGQRSTALQKKSLEQLQQEINQLEQEFQQQQVGVNRLRDSLQQQETGVDSDANQAKIQKLQNDMRTSQQAEVTARTDFDKNTEQWLKRLNTAKRNHSELLPYVETGSSEIKVLEALVQSAKEKVNQSIQNESWANRVKRKGFITQVLYEQYSLALLEAQLNLGLHQQKLQVESGLLANQHAELHQFDLENSQLILELTKTTYEQCKAYFEFVVERHRQEVGQRLVLLNILKSLQSAL